MTFNSEFYWTQVCRIKSSLKASASRPEYLALASEQLASASTSFHLASASSAHDLVTSLWEMGQQTSRPTPRAHCAGAVLWKITWGRWIQRRYHL